ncbi:MAG: tripartite tricarboxylate transporter substrate-binding protein [Woeseiaceae bacterium]|nr:tripartite tricarboxylate transporter substrate-binding protein [Woeseiaceae bacterium]
MQAKSSRAILLLLCLAASAAAAERIHFLIPGGAGGGWDATARGVGEALARSGIIEVASYENLSGGGGARALAHMIETGERQKDTLMISSSSIILRSLRKMYPQSFHELSPVASVVVDYGAFVVKNDSAYQDWHDLIADFSRNPRRVNVAGGSSRASMDHIVAALAFKKSGVDARQLKYIPYNAGGHAMVGLLSGETQVLSTGLSEAIALADQGEVRVLAITAPQRLDRYPGAATLTEQGVPVVFANWRGFFAAPGTSAERLREFQALLEAMFATTEWGIIRDNRGWTDFFVVGEEFKSFLLQQEQEMSELLRELGLLN